MTAEGAPQTPGQLLETLCDLLPAQFDILLVRLAVHPAVLSSPQAPLATRSAELLQLMLAQSRLFELQQALGDVTAPRTLPAAGPSPFVWGRPIDSEAEFLGRDYEKTLLLHAIEKGVPAEILGGQLVGKSSLLWWIGRHRQQHSPLVRLEKGAGVSPVGLVATIAERLGRPQQGAALRRSNASWETAQEALGNFTPLTLLVDDADKLALRGFDDAFLSCLRGLVEERRLTWISTSDRPLHEVFEQKGLSSDFLTSSERIWLGALDPEAALRLAARAGPALAWRLIEEAGYFAHGVQWLGDHARRHPDNIDAICDRFRSEVESVFATWCAHLRPVQRELLRRCVDGPVAVRDDGERRQMNLLVLRRLVFPHDSLYSLTPGEAWRRYVRDAL